MVCFSGRLFFWFCFGFVLIRYIYVFLERAWSFCFFVLGRFRSPDSWREFSWAVPVSPRASSPGLCRALSADQTRSPSTPLPLGLRCVRRGLLLPMCSRPGMLLTGSPGTRSAPFLLRGSQWLLGGSSALSCSDPSSSGHVQTQSCCHWKKCYPEQGVTYGIVSA